MLYQLNGTAVHSTHVRVEVRDSSNNLLFRRNHVNVNGTGNTWDVDIRNVLFRPLDTYFAHVTPFNHRSQNGPTAIVSANFNVDSSIHSVADFTLSAEGNTLVGLAYNAVTVDVVIRNESNTIVFEEYDVPVSGNDWSVDISGVTFTEDHDYTATIEAFNEHDTKQPEPTVVIANFNPLQDHLSQENPHEVEASDLWDSESVQGVGLGNVENYPVANQTQAEAGELDFYISPLGIAQQVAYVTNEIDLNTYYGT